MAFDEEKLRDFLFKVQNSVFWIYIILLIIWVNTAKRDSDWDKALYYIWTFILVLSAWAWYRMKEYITQIFGQNVQVVGV